MKGVSQLGYYRVNTSFDSVGGAALERPRP